MRGAQDIAVGLQQMLTALMPAQMNSVRERYGLVNDDFDENGLTDIASIVDTPIIQPQPNDLPQIQIEVTAKRTEGSSAVEPQNGGGTTLDRRLPVRLWVFLRGQSFPDVAHRQRYTAQAIEEVLMGNVVFPDDPTIRLDPTTVAYDLSDVGIDAKSSRSFGGIRFTFDTIFTESTLPTTGPFGTADTIDLNVEIIHPALM
jgi:hypothetical protein